MFLSDLRTSNRVGYPRAESREHGASRDDPPGREVQLTRFCLLKRVMLLTGLTRKSCRCLGTTTNSTTFLRHKYSSVFALSCLRFASSQLIRRQPSLLPLSSARALYNVMAPKQATLGYVKPTQQTIGCVWMGIGAFNANHANHGERLGSSLGRRRVRR